MSDIEDQMDVDAPKEVQFSSDNASGKKRTAADLPVEALDNLPWYGSVTLIWRRESHTDTVDRVEKYRPNSLDDVSGHQDILSTINRFVEAHVFSPSPGNIDYHSNINDSAATTPSPSIWPSRNRKDLNHPSTCTTDIWHKKHASDGPGTECQ